jgi:DNA repair exonuclease SbcCD ATPase subunit
MKIKRVIASNFYSFKNLDLNIENLSGIVKINGINSDSGGSNGSGKSSIFEAVVWGLFGKTIRKSTEESLVNNLAARDCSVTIHVEAAGSEVKIVRTKRPTSLNFFVGGVNLNRESASETQKSIEEFFQTDYKSFMASVVFGQHADQNFLESSPEEKRNILKNCFNLEEFFSRREVVKALKAKQSGEFKVLTALQGQLEKELEDLSSKIPDSKFKYIELPLLDDILEAERKIQELMYESRNIQDSIKSLKDKKRKLDSSINEGVFTSTKDCPVCKSSYVKNQTEEDLNTLEASEKAISKEILALNSKLETNKAVAESLKPQYSSSEWSKYNTKNLLVLDANNKIERYNQEKAKLEEVKLKIASVYLKLDVMKFWEQAFSEKGIVRYVVRNVLDYLNSQSNRYLSILSGNLLSIKFSDDLSEEIKCNNSDVKYISLSGGEKRKVNLSIMLALQDLSKQVSKTDSNLMFLDEVVDNIDDVGISAVNNLLLLLREEYPERVLMLITHNKLLQELLHEEAEILVEKVKGYSKIKYVTSKVV